MLPHQTYGDVVWKASTPHGLKQPPPPWPEQEPDGHLQCVWPGPLCAPSRPVTRAVRRALSRPGLPPLRALPLVSWLVLALPYCSLHIPSLRLTTTQSPSSTSPRPSRHLSPSQTPSWTCDATPPQPTAVSLPTFSTRAPSQHNLFPTSPPAILIILLVSVD